MLSSQINLGVVPLYYVLCYCTFCVFGLILFYFCKCASIFLVHLTTNIARLFCETSGCLVALTSLLVNEIALVWSKNLLPRLGTQHNGYLQWHFAPTESFQIRFLNPA